MSNQNFLTTEKAKKSVMFLSPHPDDHLLVAGTLMKFRDSGFDLFEVLFTDGSGGGNQRIKTKRARDYQKACRFLGIRRVFKLNYVNERYGKPNWEKDFDYKELIKIIQKVRPAILILPSPNDYHPEHMSVCRVGMKTIKMANYWGKPQEKLRVPVVLYFQGLLPQKIDLLIDVGDYFEKIVELTKIYEGEISTRTKQFLEGSTSLFGYFLRVKRAEGFAIPKDWPVDPSVFLG